MEGTVKVLPDLLANGLLMVACLLGIELLAEGLNFFDSHHSLARTVGSKLPPGHGSLALPWWLSLGAQDIHHEKKSNMLEMSSPSLTKEEEKTDAPTLSEEGIKGKLNSADITQEELCDNASLPQLVNEHAISSVSFCADFKHVVHIANDVEEQKHVIANHTTSSFSSFDWMKQVVLNGLCDEHHMEKPRTVFREEGEDDVTMATTDTTIAHIMDEQDDIKIKSSKCWNPIRPPATLLNSNGRQICIRPPFSAREYLMESSWSNLSNESSHIAKFHLSRQQPKKQGVATPVMGLWDCNFVWDPGPSGAHVGCAPIRNKVDLHRLDQQPTERCIDC
uniref:Retrotransposon, putative, centromere-specific n=1 Tax=Oryza sativa subsp. japonica TaxID=39947 RepID=Q6UUG8_ORYSJ|nr:hypothetical protein OSJNBa0038J12.1 [Oryza sativa Japonica Group]